ncbi:MULTISPECIES: hypothetical protein [Methylorubrum]|uniref:hypothetical protein n=1 Tax=Methylorubrum TaxID=2282523 RepID=UPI001EE15715|nr:hypothetical protein [Methylorubrum podarium]
MLTPPIIHDLIHRTLGLDHPHTHWWIDLVTVLVLVVAPAWTAWLAIRSGLRWAAARRHRTRGTAALPPPARQWRRGWNPTSCVRPRGCSSVSCSSPS